MSAQDGAVQHYYCVNCGHTGKYSKPRVRKLICTECNYDDITPLTPPEYLDRIQRRMVADAQMDFDWEVLNERTEN